LLKYMSRPLHFFGGFGALGILGGTFMAFILLGMKILNPGMDVMRHHGPMFVVGSVLIVSGIQMLAIGLLGELQVRHYYTGQHPASYAVDRLVRLASPDEQSLLSERQDGNF
ncbi:MAG: glycosyltransferase, partial [Terracidiphilus sp.]